MRDARRGSAAGSDANRQPASRFPDGDPSTRLSCVRTQEPRSRWAHMYVGRRLPLDVRIALAKRVVRWVVTPAWFGWLASTVAWFATVGLSQPRRLVALVLALPLLGVVTYLARKEAWIKAAAWLCLTGFLAIASGVLVNSVHAPINGLGFMLLGLVIALFGVGWGAAVAAALLGVGALWVGLDYAGLALPYTHPPAILRLLLYALFVGLTVAMLGGIQTLLDDALREAERKRREAEAARGAEAASELAFHAVFDQAGVGMLLLTPAGSIAQLNHRAALWLGANESTLKGRDLDAIPAWNEDQREVMLRAVQAAASGKTSRHELAVAREFGVQSVYQVSVSPFHAPDESLSHVILEIVDVSEVVQTRTELGQARRLEALGKLSGGIAHDFNNMLAAILAASELLRMARKRGDDEDSELALDGIQTTVERASSLTKQLLAFGRQDRIAAVDADIGKMLTEMARLLERTLHRNITLRVIVPEYPLYVRGDVAALDNAFLNLALNAQDAMPNGGTLTLEAHEEFVDAALSGRFGYDISVGPAVVIRVSDTGTGMTDTVRERLFEPFFTTKPVGKGTGLGLSAVHGTVRNHHGAVRVRSRIGEGSAFELYFPAVHSARVPLRSGIPERPTTARLNARVLLAEDEHFLRDAWSTMLQASGCQVQVVSDGTALLEELAAGARCDVIVTDLVMPGLSGVKLLQLLQDARPGCPLLLVTGHSADDVSAALMGSSPHRLLRKPISYADLSAALSELLEERARLSESAHSA
jgi:PAS domain S-box-containing protein